MKPISQHDTAWVTGASSGIGRAMAVALANAGYDVAISARDLDALNAVIVEASDSPGRIRAFPLDITDYQAVCRVVADIERDMGAIELAVLNAGTHRPMGLNDFSAAAFNRLLSVNAMGTVHCMDAVFAGMRKRRSGHVAVVASVSGYVGLPTAAAYGFTKAGLINMCEALKPECDGAGIKLQIVNPGFVKTPLTDRNDFPMPFLISVEEAARSILAGLASSRFEISFPWKMRLAMRFLQLLPYPLLFAVTRRMVREH